MRNRQILKYQYITIKKTRYIHVFLINVMSLQMDVLMLMGRGLYMEWNNISNEMGKYIVRRAIGGFHIGVLPQKLICAAKNQHEKNEMKFKRFVHQNI
jgi:hypothetical protein